MKATRRRQRQFDPLASRAAVREVLEIVQAELPSPLRPTEKELCSLLRAAVHRARTPRAPGRRGRRSRWSETTRELANGLLQQALSRFNPRLNPRSFTEHYLLILQFPADVAEALEALKVNLFEAEQLARLSANALQTTEKRAHQQRQQMLRVHLQAGESGIRLKARVDALLYRVRHPGSQPPRPTQPPPEQTDPFALDPADAHGGAMNTVPPVELAEVSPDHVFYEYLQLIPALMHALDPQQIPEETLDRVLHQSEQLIQQLNALYKQQYPPAPRAASETGKRFYI